ncbi:autotransporter assembly complex protein TamA [Alteraurantiacibacter aquimixticola]|uniref:Outer membrane protein assembly factor n=1 Tax=Alteraurantiacibacter aquimixticola TaxID=2489173 RepID=A0A4T3F281_9SPHN|nr:BamA/TamA family outer membrane protein [Alteraurantiacibacter aquimixticola]TIX51345.1 outer membrane protein assembly factor [Alteraurantiacibacter aquimixticola]
MTRCATALALCLGLLSQQLAAQDMSAPASLEELIPDSAVEDPEGWAQQGDQPDLPSPDDGPVPELEADSPMEAMPLLTIEAPEDLQLPDPDPVEADEPVEFATFEDVIPPLPEGSGERISDELVLVFPTERSLFPERDEFLDRFKALSTIEGLDDDGSQARLSAQARADEELLQRMLRTYGYFDGQVIRSVVSPEDRPDADYESSIARFDIIPGNRFTIGTVDLGNLSQTGTDYDDLRAAYEVFPGDPLSLDAITDERYDLDTALGESGYPFAAIDDPELLVDHARAEGDVTMPVTPGGKYVFGNVTSNLDDFLSGRHLARIARFDPGDTYKRSDEMDLRRAILATGLVGSVSLTPVEVEAPSEGQPGTVDMEVEMTKAPLRTVAGSIGYGTEEGIRIAGSWEHRNLFPPEGLFRVRGIAGTREQLLGATFRKNNFRGRDRILTLDAFASTLDYEAYDARTASLVGTYERVSTLLFQKPLSWSVGLELVATGEREADADGVFGPRQTYLIAALPLYAQIDTSDDLLDPTRGFRVSGRVSPEISRSDSSETVYVRNQADFSYYQQMSDSLVLAGRARFSSIPGASVEDIAPSRRIYAGGGGSVRGYGYREIGPRNSEGDPTGGLSAVEFSLEARIRTGMLDGTLGVVPFVDAGSVGDDALPDFRSIKFGAGIGLRYHSGFGPIRLDVAFPLNPGPNDAAVAVYVALGQAF